MLATQVYSVPAKRRKLQFGKVEQQKTYVQHKLHDGVLEQDVALVDLTITDDCKVLDMKITEIAAIKIPNGVVRAFLKHLCLYSNEARGQILVNELSFKF